MNDHQKYMQRCIELAKNGLGTTYPNPLVGSVIVHKDRLIGEGWHKKSGEPHAEVNAINAVTDKSLLAESTIYVNLEPCSHFGKTPPCADLIVKFGIPNVIIGTVDPNDIVSGNGILKLKAAGISVVVGVLETECRELNNRFFTFHQKNRPYIILKWAASADGFIAPQTKSSREPVWITNSISRQLVHKWRSEEQAILVGTKTVIDDNPRLDVRDWSGKNPIRIVIDKLGTIPDSSHVFDNQAKTIVISKKNVEKGKENVIFEEIDFGQNAVRQILAVLHKHRIQSVIIEGGSKTLQAFIDENLWDEARVFKGNVNLDGGTKAPIFNANPAGRQTITNDELLIFRNNDQCNHI